MTDKKNYPTQLLSIKELAQILSLSRRQVHRLRSCGKIGPEEIRIGGSIRYRLDECIAWINSDPSCADRETWEYMKMQAES